MEDGIVNKVANSGLVNIDLETFISSVPKDEIDIAKHLWQGLVFKEKDFRTFIKEHNWAQYKDKAVAVYCSVDAIIPLWAYMLLQSKLHNIASLVHFGREEELESILLYESINSIDVEEYRDVRVVIKGCSKSSITPKAYILLVDKLQNTAKSIMFGEPCSTVPVYKKPKA